MPDAVRRRRAALAFIFVTVLIDVLAFGAIAAVVLAIAFVTAWRLRDGGVAAVPSSARETTIG